MKKFSMIQKFLMAALLLLPISCKKNDLPHGHGPLPQDSAKKGQFMIAIDSFPGAATPATGLTAIISITDKDNKTVIKDRHMPLSLHELYETDSIEIAVGRYALSGLLIINSDSTVKFASPLAGSAKANAVMQALSIPFQVKKEKTTVGVQVLAVQLGDKPEDFGYPAGSFGSKPVPGDSATDVTIRVLPMIQVGDVVYDSIPVTLLLTAYNALGEPTRTTHRLNPGTNELTLSRAAARHTLQVYKWNGTDEIEIRKEDLQEGMTYYLGGRRDVMRLKEVLEYESTSTGEWKPHSKQYYQYDGAKLMSIQHYLKKTDGRPYVAFTETMDYTGDRITSVRSRGETVPEEEQTTFSYDAQGKLYHAEQQKGNGHVTAEVTYTALDEETGISGSYRISTVYMFNSHSNNLYYTLDVTGGNVIADNAASHSGGGESGLYEYDFGINPFAHLHLPDLYFSNLSKSNRTRAWKNYFGRTPQTEPYEYSYVYNADGYPKELITKFWNYQTKQHHHSTKTIYTYY